MMQSAQQYGMDVNEFIQVVSSNGQVPAMAGEVARSKALSVALSKAKVVNQKGKEIDLSEFTSGATAAVVDGVGSGDHDHDDHEGHNH